MDEFANGVSVGLFVVGYPVAVAVIARWVPVVRERRRRWFTAHTAAVSCIVLGWALRGRWPSVAINTAWLLASIAWYRGQRRPGGPSRRTRSGTPTVRRWPRN